MVTVPVRADPPFASTFTVTEPVPVPPCAVGRIQFAALTIVHAQAADEASTRTEMAPPPAPTPGLLGVTV
jgi:hypothetical protein